MHILLMKVDLCNIGLKRKMFEKQMWEIACENCNFMYFLAKEADLQWIKGTGLTGTLLSILC